MFWYKINIQLWNTLSGKNSPLINLHSLSNYFIYDLPRLETTSRSYLIKTQQWIDGNELKKETSFYFNILFQWSI